MTRLNALVKRNCKLFFNDKGMFITSLITPIILLVLYSTFLSNAYHSTFESAIPKEIKIDPSLIDGLVGTQLVSSLLAVSCVTVAFCSNLLMVQDKSSGARKDLTISPVKSSTLALGYFISSALVTLLICYVALAIGLVYIKFAGWYLKIGDILLLILDVTLLVLFGTSLSSLINCNLSTNGQASAVGTIVSAGYGFICGAYMPMSNFGKGLQNALSFLPSTYGTSLVRNHTMIGVFNEMEAQGVNSEIITEFKKAVDIEISFFDNAVKIPTMYAIMTITVLALVGVYVLRNILNKSKG